MAEGVDYSFARPDPAALYAAGKRFAGRYVGPGWGKLLDADESAALHAAGLDIFLNAEGVANGAAGGYAVGVSHARMARAQARSLGAPDTTAIYYAVDFDVSSKGWAAVRQYLQGACDTDGVAQVGIYGGLNAVTWAHRDGVASWFFQTYAWSYGLWFEGNHAEYIEDLRRRKGDDADMPHRIRYKKLEA